MSLNERNWIILFICGASGTGKSSVAYELARRYNVNIISTDDISQTVKAATTVKSHPAIHYWIGDNDWLDIGVNGNVECVINAGKELIPALKTITENHIQSGVPVIIEGDCIYPEFTVSFKDSKIKSCCLKEPNKNQILQNLFNREGRELQHYRAEVSAMYNKWLSDTCEKFNIPIVEALPWSTLAERVIDSLRS